MIRRLLLVILLLLLTHALRAQVVERTWQKVFDSPSVVWTVHFLDLEGPPRVGFIGCDAHVYRTSDGGATWQQCVVNTPDFIAADFSFKDSLTGWFANYLYRTDKQLPMCCMTTDGGLTWNPIFGPTTLCSSVLYRPENGLLLLASWYQSGPYPSGNSCYSTDEGKTWTVFAQREQYNGFAFLDTMNGIVGCARGTFAYTNDGGQTWNSVNSTADETWQPVALARSDSYFAMSETSQYFFTSRDKGLTFVPAGSKFGSTTGTLRAGSCGTIYAQQETKSGNRGRGIVRSQDAGQNWIALGGPVNKVDSRFYVRGGYVYAGSTDTTTGSYSVWRYVEDSTFYDGGSFDAPQVSDTVLQLVSADCGTLDSSLRIVYLNDCSSAELLSVTLGPTARFAVALKDTLPVRISGAYSIPILYSPIGHDGDTALLTLTYRTHGKDTQAVVRVIGSVPGTHTIARFQLQAGGAPSVSSIAGSTVPIDLVLLNDIASTLGLDSIAFDLTYDESVAMPLGFTVNPPWSLLRQSQTTGHQSLAFRRTAGADLAANSTIARFQFKTYLTTRTQTEIRASNFRLNDSDSVYLGCTATATDPGSVLYLVRDTCGDDVLRHYMLNEPVVTLLQDAISVHSPTRETATITVTDLLGRVMLERAIVLKPENTLIDLTRLDPGVYFGRVQTTSGFVRTVHFVRAK